MQKRFSHAFAFSVSIAGLLFVGAGCAATQGGSVAANPAPAPAPAPAPTSAPTPSAAPVAEASTVTVTVTGAETEHGTFPAHCGYAYPATMTGAVFQASFDGWQLSSINDSSRTPGVQTQLAVLNSPHHGYHQSEAAGDATVTWGADLKTATVKGKFIAGIGLTTDPTVNVDATFTCK